MCAWGRISPVNAFCEKEWIYDDDDDVHLYETTLHVVERGKKVARMMMVIMMMLAKANSPINQSWMVSKTGSAEGGDEYCSYEI